MSDTSPNVMLSLAVNGESSPKRFPKRKKMASRLPRLHVRADESAEMSGVSLATWWRWDASGVTPAAKKIGGVKLWSVRSLKLWSRWGCPNRREFVDRLATFEADAARHNSRKGGR
jgi:predicted DNA-binding transcriptional regulator AlpA